MKKDFAAIQDRGEGVWCWEVEGGEMIREGSWGRADSNSYHLLQVTLLFGFLRLEL